MTDVKMLYYREMYDSEAKETVQYLDDTVSVLVVRDNSGNKIMEELVCTNAARNEAIVLARLVPAAVVTVEHEGIATIVVKDGKVV